MAKDRSTVFIVDDDRSVRTALARLMRSRKMLAETFASAEEFLDRDPRDAPGCIVLDLKMPGVTGLELQEDLTAAGISLPIVFLTGHGDVPDSVAAMKGGAVDFFEKPVDEDELMDAIKQAVEWDIRAREKRAELIEVQERLNDLTPRESQVFRGVVQGKLNKQIASGLGMSEKTVKVHRARVMQKMQADSLAGLVRIAERIGAPLDAADDSRSEPLPSRHATPATGA
ncbi:MAG: response regulator [Gemmatimonadetes bacterium]|nr:response regulator [Gemmatimonadota bacterium]